MQRPTILLISLLLSLLAACGGGGDDDGAEVPDTGPPRVGCDITPRPPGCL